MKEGRPSLTAQGVAMRRAAHQVFDIPLVFEDSVALRIIGPEGRSRLAEHTGEPRGLGKYLRAFVAVRSRYAEDQLATAVQRGVRQYVVLGAGLDTFAYRNPYAERDLQVFEVDHPATQAWKRQLLAHTAICVPSSVTFVPVDFERQTLDKALEHSGFKLNEPAFFSWLGVTPYLAEETVMTTLRLIHSLSPASGVVFDFGVPSSLLSWTERIARDNLASRVARVGEEMRTFFEPMVLAQSLKEIGFGYLEDLGPEEINLRYFNGRNDGLCVRGGARLMCALGEEKTPTHH